MGVPLLEVQGLGSAFVSTPGFSGSPTTYADSEGRAQGLACATVCMRCPFGLGLFLDLGFMNHCALHSSRTHLPFNASTEVPTTEESETNSEGRSQVLAMTQRTQDPLVKEYTINHDIYKARFT